jgi:hypothetical protein
MERGNHDTNAHDVMRTEQPRHQQQGDSHQYLGAAAAAAALLLLIIAATILDALLLPSSLPFSRYY